MLQCRDITILASDYIDGRLRWRKRLAVLMHLLICRHCWHFMRNFRLVIRLMQGHPPPALDEQTIHRLDRAVDNALDESDKQ